MQGTVEAVGVTYALVQAIEKELPSLVDIAVDSTSKITVCGDTHGQYFDLLHIFELNGLPSMATLPDTLSRDQPGHCWLVYLRQGYGRHACHAPVALPPRPALTSCMARSCVTSKVFVNRLL